MKNIVKILFGTILSLSIFNFSYAGEMTVTGTAEATYTISGSDSATAKIQEAKAIGLANELAFTATGEFGNGYSWKYQIELDPSTGTNGAALNDDTRLELGFGDIGTIGIYGSEGDLNTQLKSSVAAYAPGHDFGSSGNYQGGTGMNSYNNLQYHTAAGLLPYGITVKAAYSNGDNIASNDAANAGKEIVNQSGIRSYQVMAKPLDGLSVGASYLTKRDTGTATIQDYETGGAFATYSIANFSFGIGRHFTAPNTNGGQTGTAATAAVTCATAASSATNINVKTCTVDKSVEYFQNDAMSVAFNVNEQLSVSYDELDSTAEMRTIVQASAAATKANRSLEVKTLQAAYNVGGAVVTVSQKHMENVSYEKGIDRKETMFGIKMAF